ncbi:anaerobic magnesium-protoporphyrin IX monomethyl ester cyclase [uncultured Gammaproteobacteria bacterium]
MAETVDILFISPGDRKQIYQSLGDEFCAIEPPVFAGLFATYARRKGARVAIIDGPALNLSAQDIARRASEDYAPTLVVIVVYGFQPSASTQNMTAAGAVARAIKQAAPGIKLLMTGTHPAALPERTLSEEAVDFVCDREGPATIVKTWQALAAKNGDFSTVPSLWWRDGARLVAPVASEGLIDHLDQDMPGIAWDLLPMERYRAHNWHAFEDIDHRSPYAAIHTSLGCPYHCGFCCINAPFGKSSYRMWEPASVIREIDFLVETYGVKHIKFVDEMFVLNKQHVLEICDLLISRDYKVNIWAYARVDTVKDEFLDKLKRAGFNWLCLGIESASQYVRDGAAKRYGNRDIIDVVRRIQNAGIYVIGNYIFGLPDDTLDSMQDTLDLALELNCEFANFYSAMAYPGSKLHTQAVREGAALPKEWYHYSQHAYDCLPLSNQNCRAAEILGFRDQAWNAYFTAPRYLDMVRTKFGQNVVDHIQRMTAIPLRRKLLEPAAACTNS